MEHLDTAVYAYYGITVWLPVIPYRIQGRCTTHNPLARAPIERERSPPTSVGEQRVAPRSDSVVQTSGINRARSEREPPYRHGVYEGVMCVRTTCKRDHTTRGGATPFAAHSV